LLGPYAVAAAAKERSLRSSKLVAPVVTRHITLGMSRHGILTLACRTVMQLAREIAKKLVWQGYVSRTNNTGIQPNVETWRSFGEWMSAKAHRRHWAMSDLRSQCGP
jgi:hypothetical protein